jgi:tRNA pseudouridine55 synthase
VNSARAEKVDVHGWIALDKPTGVTSTEAVAAIKRLFRARKAGHAGTLDPLASGVLPIAFGEATKTVPFVMDGRKAYRFTVRWGVETDTDDAEGRAVERSERRPSIDAIEQLLPNFVGVIDQTPPKFSALKVEGARAYDLAREGAEIELAPRPVEIDRLEIVETADADHTTFEAECGKGTYVRALARDLGRALGCYGHVQALRRLQVGPFSESDAVTLDQLARVRSEQGEAALAGKLSRVEAGLAALPALSVSAADAQRLALGQSVILRGRDAPILEGLVSVSTQGALVALGEVEQGALRPRRIFHLPR